MSPRERRKSRSQQKNAENDEILLVILLLVQFSVTLCELFYEILQQVVIPAQEVNNRKTSLFSKILLLNVEVIEKAFDKRCEAHEC